MSFIYVLGYINLVYLIVCLGCSIISYVHDRKIIAELYTNGGFLRVLRWFITQPLIWLEVCFEKH